MFHDSFSLETLGECEREERDNELRALESFQTFCLFQLEQIHALEDWLTFSESIYVHM